MTPRRFLPALLLLLATPAVAFEFRTGDGTNTLVLPPADRLEREALLVGQALDVQGHAAQDLWLLASTASRFAGSCDGDLRVLARSATFAGQARRNLIAYAAGLQLATNSAVLGDVALFGRSVVCEGSVAGNAWIYAQSVTLGGSWGGSVRVVADEISLAPGTAIAGRLVYSAPKPPVIDSSVSIRGGAESRAPLLPDSGAFPPAASSARFMLHGYLFLAALLLGMPFVGFFPALAGGAVRRLRTSPWRVLLAGLIAIVGGPFLIAFAAMTLVGLPLALLLGALYLLLAGLSQIVVALWIGHLLLRVPGPQSFGQVLSAMATGLFVLYFASAFPGIASLLLLPVLVLGSGALITARLPQPRPLPPPPPVRLSPEPPMEQPEP